MECNKLEYALETDEKYENNKNWKMLENERFITVGL